MSGEEAYAENSFSVPFRVCASSAFLGVAWSRQLWVARIKFLLSTFGGPRPRFRRWGDPGVMRTIREWRVRFREDFFHLYINLATS